MNRLRHANMRDGASPCVVRRVGVNERTYNRTLFSFKPLVIQPGLFSGFVLKARAHRRTVENIENYKLISTGYPETCERGTIPGPI